MRDVYWMCDVMVILEKHGGSSQIYTQARESFSGSLLQ